MEQAGDEIAAIIAGADSLDDVNAGLEEWKEETAIFSQLGDAIFVTTVMADMAGQLMVAGREASVVQLAAGDANRPPSPKPFLDLPWADAIDAFKKRGLVKDSDFETLLKDYAQRSAVARRLMLDQVQTQVMQHLETAIEQGETFPQFAAKVNKLTDDLGLSRGKPSYLQMVFRTNVQSAYGAGRYKAMTNPVVMRARPFVQYRTVGDHRVRDEHAVLDGKTFRADDPVWQRIAPPNGFNCFPGDTLVQGAFTAAVRAHYTGQVVKLTTESGCTLSVTPNHPLLTPDGFVPAASIKQGTHVVCYDGGAKPATVGQIDPQDAPVTIEQLFDTFAIRDGSTIRFRPRPDYFNGDAQAFNGDVYVVAAYRKLLDAWDTQRCQRLSDRILTPSLACPAHKASLGTERTLSLGTNASPGSVPSLAALASYRTGILPDALPLEAFCIGSAARLNASRYQVPHDDGSADAQFIRQLLDRSAGMVRIDKVLSIQLDWFHGFVYDAECAERGWLVAGGIIASNCRCSMVTLSGDEAEGVEISTEIPEDYVPTPGFDQPPMAELNVPAAGAAPPPVPRAPRQAPPAPTPKVQPLPLPQQPQTQQPAPAPKPQPPSKRVGPVAENVFGHKVSEPELDALSGANAALPVDTRVVYKVEEQKNYAIPSETGGVLRTDTVFVSGSIRNESNEQVGQFDRMFYRDGDQLIAVQKALRVREDQQGTGLGKQLFNAQINAYESMGVNRVRLDANEVGRYVWTKAGFEWDDPAQLTRILGQLRTHLAKRFGATSANKIMQTTRTPQDIARLVVDGERVGKDFLVSLDDEVITMSQAPSKITRL